MGFFQILSLILTLLVKFGPGLFSLGKQVYDAVEAHSAKEKAAGKELTGEEKAAKFNEMLKTVAQAKNKTITPAKINLLREGVWALNNQTKVAGK